MCRNQFIVSLLGLFAIGLLVVVPPAAANLAQDHLIIAAADGAAVVADYEAAIVGEIGALGLMRISAETTVLDAIANDPRVTASYSDSLLDARPSYFIGTSDIMQVEPFDLSDPTFFTEQAAVERLRIAEANTLSTGSTITVAIIDTGVDTLHPLFGTGVSAGWDFVDNDAVADDPQSNVDSDGDNSFDEAAGHGTHVAGIVRLVAPDVTIMPLRILDSNGRALNFDLADSIVYAVDQGADVINLSGNSSANEPFVSAAIDYAHTNEVIVVASAGLNTIGYPAAHSNTISVAATSADGFRTDFSMFGANEVTAYAPGELIVSAYTDGRYARWTGHSMATPFISGAAALMLATGSCDYTCVHDNLLHYARPVDMSRPTQTALLPDLFDAVGAAAGVVAIDLQPQVVHTLEGSPTDNVRDVAISIANLGNSLPLSELTLRYWYSNESLADELFICDFAPMGCDNVTHQFVTVADRSGASQYVEVAFSAESPPLYGNDNSGTMFLRMHHSDWSLYDETNDYSYNATNATDWDKVTVYHNGTLVYGSEPQSGSPTAVQLNTSAVDTPLVTALVMSLSLVFLLTGHIYLSAKAIQKPVRLARGEERPRRPFLS